MIKIKFPSQRIEYMAKKVGKQPSFIDVGCDHGYVSIYVASLNQKSKVIALDVSENCVLKAKDNAKKFEVKNIEFLVSNGLENVPKRKYGACLIAGMGAEEIVNILENVPKELKIKNFYLQPATKMLYLKEWLNKNNYKIVEDEIIFDKNHFYNFIKVKKGKQKLNLEQLFFGKTNLKRPNDVFKKYVRLNYTKLLEYCKKSNKKSLQNELELFKWAIRRMD